MRQERLDLDPFAAPFRETEIRLPDAVEEPHLRFVRDVQVEHGAVQLPDDVLSRKAVFDEESIEDLSGPEELALQSLLDQFLHFLRSDRARDLVEDIRVDRRTERSRDLEGIHSSSHVPFRHVDEGFHPVLRDLELLGLRDPADVFSDRLRLQRSEAEDRGPGLDRFDQPRGVVRGQNEPRGLRIRLHRPPHRRLGVRGQVVGLVEEDDLEGRPSEWREPSDFLHLRSDGLDAALVAAVQLVVILPPGLSEHVAREGHRAGRLARPRRTREEEVRQVPFFRISLQAFDDLVLADDLVEGLRAILLDPDFLHRRPQRARGIWGMRNKPLARGGRTYPMTTSRNCMTAPIGLISVVVGPPANRSPTARLRSSTTREPLSPPFDNMSLTICPRKIADLPPP